MKHAVFSNVFYQVLVKILTSAVTLIATILIASSFGPTGYGLFTQVITLVGICYVVSDFGLNAIFIHEEEKRFPDFLAIRIAISTASVIFILILSFVLYWAFHIDGLFIGVLLFSGTIIGQSILTTSSAVFQKKLRYDLLLKAIFAGSIVTFLGILFGWWISSFSLMLLSFAVGSVVSALISLFFATENIFPLRWDTVFAKKILSQSFPLCLMLLFNLAYFRADIIILSFLRTQAEVGIYGYAYRFFDFLLTLPLFLSNVLYPFMVQDMKAGALSARVRKYFLAALLLSFVLVVVGWFAAPLLGIVKNDFSKSILPFRILLLSFPFFVATSFFQWLLIAQKKQTYLLWVYIVSGIVNVLLNILLIPSFGYVASASITGLSELLVLILLFGKSF